MSNEILRKADWHAHLRNQVIPADEMVKLWVHPHGCICEVRVVEGLPVLVNGEHMCVNALLAKMLLDAGIKGHIIVHTTEIIPQNTARWLTWWLSQPVEDAEKKLKTITVTTFSQRPTSILPVQVEVIEPIQIHASDVISTVGMKSRGQHISLFEVERDNGQRYRLEPARKIDATIIDVTKNGFVLRCTNNNVFLVNKVSKRIQGQLTHYKLKPADLIGTAVKVQYTMFTEGHRLCNYKSPIVFRSISLDNMGEYEQAPYDVDYLFPAPEKKYSASLTSTRCSRATVTLHHEPSLLISGVDKESGTTLFTFRPDDSPGVYGAEFEVGGKIEHWRFDSPFSVDVIDPEGFIRSVSDNIYYATGYSLRRIALRYTDHTDPSAQPLIA